MKRRTRWKIAPKKPAYSPKDSSTAVVRLRYKIRKKEKKNMRYLRFY